MINDKLEIRQDTSLAFYLIHYKSWSEVSFLLLFFSLFLFLFFSRTSAIFSELLTPFIARQIRILSRLFYDKNIH